MSTIIMSQCWPLQMPPTPKSVLISLADNANDQGACWPSIKTIADRTCFSERAVQSAIKWLEDHGLLKADRSNGRHTTYVVTPGSFREPPQEMRGLVVDNPRSRCTPAADAPPQEMRGTPAADAPHPSRSCGGPPQEVPSNHHITVNEPSGNRQAPRAKPDGFVLPDWIPVEAWEGYLQMRKEKRKSPTDRARELVIRELGKLHAAGQDIEAVLNQSTRNDWTDVYPLKQQQQATRGGRHGAPQDDQARRDAENEEAYRMLIGKRESEVIDG